MYERPHGQVGKAYRATFIANLAIISAAILLSCAYGRNHLKWRTA